MRFTPHLITFCFFFSLSASYYTTYRNQLITPENISALSQQDLSGQERSLITTMLDRYKEVIEHCLYVPTDENERRSLNITISRLLKNNPIKNLSPNNYVFSIPQESYLIKIPSKKQKLPRSTKTYYAAGRVATGLLIKKYYEEKRSDYIQPVNSYLFSLGENREYARDDHCFAVEEKVTIKLLKDLTKKERKKYITPACLREILDVTLYAGLWDMHQRNVGIDEKGRIRMVDFELSPAHNPENFFYTNEEELLYNACHGIEHIFRWFKIGSSQRDTVEAWMQKHPVLQKAPNYHRLELYCSEI